MLVELYHLQLLLSSLMLLLICIYSLCLFIYYNICVLLSIQLLEKPFKKKFLFVASKEERNTYTYILAEIGNLRHVTTNILHFHQTIVARSRDIPLGMTLCKLTTPKPHLTFCHLLWDKTKLCGKLLQ